MNINDFPRNNIWLSVITKQPLLQTSDSGSSTWPPLDSLPQQLVWWKHFMISGAFLSSYVVAMTEVSKFQVFIYELISCFASTVSLNVKPLISSRSIRLAFAFKYKRVNAWFRLCWCAVSGWGVVRACFYFALCRAGLRLPLMRVARGMRCWPLQHAAS